MGVGPCEMFLPIGVTMLRGLEAMVNGQVIKLPPSLNAQDGLCFKCEILETKR
jgi:hypothetical protein